MTTLKDYKEKVLKEFREMELCEGHFDGTAEYDKDKLESFLSLAIDNAVAEAFKAVEVERRLIYGVMTDTMTTSFGGYNDAISEIEDRKKQYLV